MKNLEIRFNGAECDYSLRVNGIHKGIIRVNWNGSLEPALVNHVSEAQARILCELMKEAHSNKEEIVIRKNRVNYKAVPYVYEGK